MIHIDKDPFLELKDDVVSAFIAMLRELESAADANNDYALQDKAINWRKLFGEMLK